MRILCGHTHLKEIARFAKAHRRELADLLLRYGRLNTFIFV